MPPRRNSAQKRIDLTVASDQMLIELTREGVNEAFGELWSRHNCSVIGVARAFTNFDPNDLMQEAFLKVYANIVNGGAAPISFRAYVATAVRNLARDQARKQPSDFVDSYEDEYGNEAVTEDDFSDRVLADSTTAQAFNELPTRFREVLWYRDVEDLPVQEVARYVGMTPNTATVTIKRARDAFKTAWIKVQLSPAQDLPEACAFVVGKLASYSRGKLTATETATIDLHLLDCVHCIAVASEANRLHKHLALVLLPLLLLSGGPAYLEWIQSGKNRTPIPAAANYVNISLTPVRRLPIAAKGASAAFPISISSSALAVATVSLLVLGTGALTALRSEFSELQAAPKKQSDTTGTELDELLTTADTQETSEQNTRAFIEDEPEDMVTASVLQPQEPVLLPPPAAVTPPPPAPQTPTTPPLPPPPPADPVPADPPPAEYATYRELSTVSDPVTGSLTLSATPGARVHIMISAPRTTALHEYITLDETGEFTYDFPEHRGKVVNIQIEQTYDTVDGPVTPADVILISSHAVPA